MCQLNTDPMKSRVGILQVSLRTLAEKGKATMVIYVLQRLWLLITFYNFPFRGPGSLFICIFSENFSCNCVVQVTDSSNLGVKSAAKQHQPCPASDVHVGNKNKLLSSIYWFSYLALSEFFSSLWDPPHHRITTALLTTSWLGTGLTSLVSKRKTHPNWEKIIIWKTRRCASWKR